MKVYLLKPFRQHKAKTTVKMEPRLAEAVIRRGIGIIKEEKKKRKTKEEKRTYETKSRTKPKKGEEKS